MAQEVLALGERLAAETTCPLCLELFSQPVLTACGHSFCQQCVSAVLGDPRRPAACPLCRSPLQPGSLRPSRSLGAVAELARAMRVQARARCPQHGSLMVLFCQPCAVPLCVTCCSELQHRPHRVLPAEEAARELRNTLQKNLLFLQKQKERLEPKGDQNSRDLLMKVMSELQRVPETFKELQQFLKEQEEMLLAQLQQVSQELVEKRCEYSSRVLEREWLLDMVIAQIKEMQDKPVVEFLMDVGKILSSFKAASTPIPKPISPKLQRRVESLSEMSQLVVDMAAKIKVNLQSGVVWEKEEVMLDPETASPYLMLSRDHRTIWRQNGKRNLPDTSKRFTGSFSVLGSQGFTSGRHYWEVEVEKGVDCAMGVALESVPRKESLPVAMEKIWALRLSWDGQYRTFHMPPVLLAFREELQRIRVHLEYEAGRVTFYNAESMMQILQFEATFTERVFPYFWVWSDEMHIRLCD
ncbi:E3 ubiquitin-protein ligase TRIM7-like [Oenanthe melanoleuca]|uniref:E3 ubiquitin-protein ligase TRIM7-like n=1 Tax=Oenanthe melanoleuca TaxID=2939378 RepID=UPI0024C1F70E|nr:E3 ubiquitin-protein ligase TRIM7-like [Oenanthe melanoleuca]